jgi:hypothetical protein
MLETWILHANNAECNEEVPCMLAVMLSSATAEQNDSIFQISPKDSSHHENTASSCY